jgi:hypothetical protein
LRAGDSRRTIRRVKSLALLLVLLAGCGASTYQEHSEPAEDPAVMPRSITWEDGKEAYEAGPFGSRMQMRRVVTSMCRRWGGSYELLDEDEKKTISSDSTRVLGGVSTQSDVKSKLTVIFRCK